MPSKLPTSKALATKRTSAIPAIANTDAPLQQFRNQIDAIDAEILRLLKQRGEVVEQVGAYKTQAGIQCCFIRPAREAVMLRYLLQADVGHYPRRELLAIWRLFIGGFTNIEQDITLSIYAPNKQPELHWAAREFFGASSTMRLHHNISKVLVDIRDDVARVAALPMPVQGESDSTMGSDGAWWYHLTTSAYADIKLYATIPFVQDKAIPMGVLLAKLQPEPSGDDVTLLVVRHDEGCSRAALCEKLQQALTATGDNADSPSLQWLASHQRGMAEGKHKPLGKKNQAASHAPLQFYDLFSLPRFIHPTDPNTLEQWQALQMICHSVGAKLYYLGSYASPIVLAE